MEDNQKTVTPKVLSSILPFGLNEKGNAYRFSLCIDLLANYAPDGDQQVVPDLTKLRQFLYGYGSKGGFAQKIRENFQVSITVNKVKNDISHKLCFSEFDSYQSYWERLLGTDSLHINYHNNAALMVAKNRPATTYKPINYFDHKVLTLPKIRTADSVFRKLVTGQPELKEMKDGRQQHELIRELIQMNDRDLPAHIQKMDDLLSGIDRFAYQKNKTQAVHHFANATRLTSVYDTIDSIRGLFSFIASNTLLQRLFSTVIDFEITVADIKAHVSPNSEFKIMATAPFPTYPGPESNVKRPQDDEGLVDWVHLVTPMEYLQNSGGAETIIVRRDEKNWFDDHQHSFANYDFGGKLKSLTPLQNKIMEINKQIDDGTVIESQRAALYRKVIALDTAALTRGMNLYNMNVDQELQQFLTQAKIAVQSISTPNPTLPNELTEDMVKKGLRFAIKGKNGLIPLGSRRVRLEGDNGDNIPIPLALQSQEFAVSTDSGMQALVPEVNDQNKTQLQSAIILDNVVLSWNGENIGMPSIFSNVEDETHMEAQESEGSVSSDYETVSKTFLKIFKEEYEPSGVLYHGKIRHGGETISLNGTTEDGDGTAKNKVVTAIYSFNQNAKLLFGKTHELTLVGQYKNGWGISFNSRAIEDPAPGSAIAELGYADLGKSIGDPYRPFLFKRNEPVGPVQFYLEEPLIDHENGKAASGREGESKFHLVIRNYTPEGELSARTRQKSVRYLLPPAISFEHAFWHNKIFEMDRDDSYKWYKKYHFPIIENAQKKDHKGNPVDGEFYSEDEAFEGSTTMREFYADHWYLPDSLERKHIINYLPDPLSKGFRLEFFIDKYYSIKAKDFEKYEKLEFYFSGDYPKIHAWKLIVKDTGTPGLSVDNEEITLSLEKGRELFIIARTILDESYEQLFETYGNYNEYTKFGGNDLLTPPQAFSAVHAVQRPLIRPILTNVVSTKKIDTTTRFELCCGMHSEQLDIWESKDEVMAFISETLPTGTLELYTKCEEYNDDPNHVSAEDGWTPDLPVSVLDVTSFGKGKGEIAATLETKIDLDNNQLSGMQKSMIKVDDRENISENYSADFCQIYDIKETKYLEKWVWIKNRSKFTSYFPGEWAATTNKPNGDEPVDDHFSRTSQHALLVKVLNNKKPNPPRLADKNITLVSVTEEASTAHTTTRKASLNRLRLYFERGRFSSGKGERIGFVLNESESPYNDDFIASNTVSRVGRDIVSDSVKPFDGLTRSQGVYLQVSNFVIHDPIGLHNDEGQPAKDLGGFSPQYVKELGLMTYLPRYDKVLNLWYLDVELDINDGEGKELHNPFIQFAMVNYQENSYNEHHELETDYRISSIEMSGFVYVMGSRTISLHHHRDAVEIVVSADQPSLVRQAKLSSHFYAFVEWKHSSEVKWKQAFRDENDSAPAFDEIAPGARSTIAYHRSGLFKDYRLVVAETESRTQINTVKDIKELIEHKLNRVVSINLFDL